MPSLAPHHRIRQIETALPELWHRYAGQYRGLAHQVAVHGTNPVQHLAAAERLFRPRLRFRRGADDLNRGTLHELLRPPHALLAHGGDCDAINLGFFGGILNTLHPEAAWRSLYWPNQLAPRHATLGLCLGRHLMLSFDITQPSAINLCPPAGYWSTAWLKIPAFA